MFSFRSGRLGRFGGIGFLGTSAYYLWRNRERISKVLKQKSSSISGPTEGVTKRNSSSDKSSIRSGIE